MNEPNPQVLARAARVRLILLDADGVLTDGRLMLGADGSEVQAFDITDGHGIRMGQRAGLDFGVLSGRQSQAVARRAAELGISDVRQGIHDKAPELERILARFGLNAEAACYMGDDLMDVPVLRRVGLAAAPAGAQPDALRFAHYVTTRRGGRGAVRELIELVLRARGAWDEVTKHYFG